MCRMFGCLIFLLIHFRVDAEVVRKTGVVNTVTVNKCCEKNEIYMGRHCTVVNSTKEEWRPLFTSVDGKTNVQMNYTLATGSPDCGHMQMWPIYHYQNSTDRLRLLPNGVLRHYYDGAETLSEEEYIMDMASGSKALYHDYGFGKYCLDKKVEVSQTEFAWVCAPDLNEDWMTNTEFIMRNLVSPATHGMTIACLLAIAIIYFVMPTLRDLTGNIVTTICMCLIVSQAADTVRLLTVFRNHVSLLITGAICYISLLAAFFWLNSLGYYIWKTFKSRNVFLRITDGKKYCYYGGYAWSCTIVLGALGVFAHFTMDYPEMGYSRKIRPSEDQQDEIGSLGMIIFFVPIAFTVLINVFFFATTLRTINKMHTYGRIHHKLRHTFRMFLLLLLTMTLCWLFFLASFSKYDGLINAHIIVNAFQGPIIFYVCILNQKHVAYLIQKTCCYKTGLCPCVKNDPEAEWGDEMTAMNTGNY